jgi:protein O-mannosyl-transferase
MRLTAPSLLHALIWFVVLAGGLAGIYHFYSLTFTFGFSFDDSWNLAPLKSIASSNDALQFVFGGNAGPLGRPLSLASFLIHQHSWPSNPEDFIRFNTLVHLVNGLLLIWVTLRLSVYFAPKITQPAWFALAVGLAWASSPILVSTTVMVVQRMTSLSALFSLVALLGYVISREQLRMNPARGFLLMSLAVGTGTIASVLCKENGALTPLLIACCEFLVLGYAAPIESNVTKKWMRIWCMAFFALPALLLLAYFIVGWDGVMIRYQSRDFSLIERMFTEARILFSYLKLLIVPDRSEIGPFHDDYVVSSSLLSPATTIFSILALLIMVIAVFLCAKRFHHYVAFGIAWFLVGHLVESTVAPLELYFEHRNYLPSIGLAIALGVVARVAIGRYKPVVVLVAILLANSAFVFREIALVWNNRQSAAKIWSAEHPNSLRAMQMNLQAMQAAGDLSGMMSALEIADTKFGTDQSFATAKILPYCDEKSAVEVTLQVQKATQLLNAGSVSYIVPDTIDKLLDKVTNNSCEGLKKEQLLEMLDKILANPGEKTHPGVLAMAHEIYARYFRDRADLNGTMFHLESSFALRPTLSVGGAMVGALATAQLYDDAHIKIDEIERAAPLRPFVYRHWMNVAAGLRRSVENTMAAQSAKAASAK